MELKFEDKGIFVVQRFTSENLFLTKALQVYYISRYFLWSLIVSKYKNISEVQNMQPKFLAC